MNSLPNASSWIISETVIVLVMVGDVFAAVVLVVNRCCIEGSCISGCDCVRFAVVVAVVLFIVVVLLLVVIAVVGIRNKSYPVGPIPFAIKFCIHCGKCGIYD